MRTVVLGPPPHELAALIARRHELGLDRFDEVWDGEYHMAPTAHGSHGWLDDQVVVFLHPLAASAGLFTTSAFNLGEPGDFRVPDHGVHRVRPNVLWFPTAAIVIEIESPDDETWEKLPFYAGHGVDEVLIVSGERRSVTWLVLEDGGYTHAEASRLLGPESASLAYRIDWPDDVISTPGRRPGGP